jgi:hypothetical protein
LPFEPLLQSLFVLRIASVAVVSALLLPGCGKLPETFPAPAQRAPLEAATSGGPGHFVAMSDANAGAYIVQGFRAASEGSWRWAHEHPVLRFYLPQLERATFTMAFALPEQTFRLTGPVTLTFSINGRVLDRARYDQSGEQQYTHMVPREFLKPDSINLVAIDPDKTAAPNPGERLAFVLVRAGFTE